MFAWYPRINQSWDLSLQNSSNPCMTAPAYLFDCLFPGLVYRRQLDEGWKVVWRGENWKTREEWREMEIFERIYSISWNWFLFYWNVVVQPIFYGFLNQSNFIFPFFQIITWLTYCKFCNIWNSLLEIRMYSIFKDLSSLFFFFRFFRFLIFKIYYSFLIKYLN